MINRRYQRNLVWTVEEKKRLIDSVFQDLPISLILLAETRDRMAELSRMEVIERLPRLNAVFALIENEFRCNESFRPGPWETRSSAKIRACRFRRPMAGSPRAASEPRR